jgi:hypothetical protein
MMACVLLAFSSSLSLWERAGGGAGVSSRMRLARGTARACGPGRALQGRAGLNQAFAQSPAKRSCFFSRPRPAPGGTRRGLMLWRPSLALRLHCDARPPVVPHNSLRSLRSLRSDRCGKSDHEARCARRLKACASRRHRNRPRRVPPGAIDCRASLQQIPAPRHQGRESRGFGAPAGRGGPQKAARPPLQRTARAARSAPLRRRERRPRLQVRLRGLGRPERGRSLGEPSQGSWPRAQRASCSDSSKLFERSGRSERSELFDGAMSPSIAGKPERQRRPPQRSAAAWPGGPLPRGIEKTKREFERWDNAQFRPALTLALSQRERGQDRQRPADTPRATTN